MTYKSRLVGLIGGVSPESTQIYYRAMNEAASVARGVDHSATVLIYALDYGAMVSLYHENRWDEFNTEVAKAAMALKDAGVEALVITSNTTHVAAEAARAATGLPLIHMLDVLAAKMTACGVRRPLLLGTPFVMSGDFYVPAIRARFDGDVFAPSPDEQEEIGRIILDELVRGQILDQSRETLKRIIRRAHGEGADGVILGCTELCMILSEPDADLPIFDTTGLHARAAADFMLGGA